VPLSAQNEAPGFEIGALLGNGGASPPATPQLRTGEAEAQVGVPTHGWASLESLLRNINHEL
jgi:hypothetical protein